MDARKTYKDCSVANDPEVKARSKRTLQCKNENLYKDYIKSCE